MNRSIALKLLVIGVVTGVILAPQHRDPSQKPLTCYLDGAGARWAL